MTIVERLRGEHARLSALMAELVRHLSADGRLEKEEARDSARKLVNALERHELVEDRVLYRRLLDRGAIAPEVLGIFQDGHRAVHLSLAKFADAMKEGGGPRRYASGSEFIEALREHFEEEERLLFPWVEANLPADELEELADRAEAFPGE